MFEDLFPDNWFRWDVGRVRQCFGKKLSCFLCAYTAAFAVWTSRPDIAKDPRNEVVGNETPHCDNVFLWNDTVRTFVQTVMEIQCYWLWRNSKTDVDGRSCGTNGGVCG